MFRDFFLPSLYVVSLRPRPNKAIDSFYYLPNPPIRPNPAFNKVLLSRFYLFAFNEKSRINGTLFFAQSRYAFICHKERITLATVTYSSVSNYKYNYTFLTFLLSKNYFKMHRHIIIARIVNIHIYFREKYIIIFFLHKISLSQR